VSTPACGAPPAAPRRCKAAVDGCPAGVHPTGSHPPGRV